MSSLPTLPVEILSTIVHNLEPPHPESSKCAWALEHWPTVHQAYGYDKPNLRRCAKHLANDTDIAAWQLMRTCRILRDVVLDLTFREDTSTWTAARMKYQMKMLRNIESWVTEWQAIDLEELDHFWKMNERIRL